MAASGLMTSSDRRQSFGRRRPESGRAARHPPHRGVLDTCGTTDRPHSHPAGQQSADVTAEVSNAYQLIDA
jgi:hypothetical protein